MSFISDVTKSIGKVGDIVKKTYGPLAALEANGISKAVLRYPLDVGDSRMYPHTVEFQTWIPRTTTIDTLEPVRSVKGGINSAISGIRGYADKLATKVGVDIPTEGPRLINNDIGDTSYLDMAVNRNQALNSRMFDFIRRADRSDLIAMYLPVSWMDQQNNAYNEKSMTDAFGRIGAIVEAGSSVAEAMEKWNDLGGAVKQIVKVGNGPTGMEAIGGVASGLGMDGGTIRDAGLNAIGYAMNPQFEILYGGTNMREFQFDFTMTPRNKKESEMVRSVVNKFKYHASPQYTENWGRYLIPPSYFDISFKYNGTDSKWLPLVSTCVLRNVSVNYTGDMEQWATHEDGSPVQVKMTLQFVELEMMHKALRAEGY